MKKLLKILFILFIIILFLYIQNNLIVIDSIQVSSARLPNNFDGFRIVHLSDLHGKVFGKDNTELISKIKKLKPDIIVITGDLIDSSFYNEKDINNFISGISQLFSYLFCNW